MLLVFYVFYMEAYIYILGYSISKGLFMYSNIVSILHIYTYKEYNIKFYKYLPYLPGARIACYIRMLIHICIIYVHMYTYVNM